ncbi:hypothetical protein MUG78_15215 [Gordonia alkaliphila]|uniref:hypothetical protein n=1 Tax=Gordonia alkaliphila TaxID=1053547 RepID=UPI001FF13DFE|nr:hypothetical protein [Gordonia alkaliphila]MCK0440765.1 hypothetical protein [Gordonia alkaliphila]
MGTHRSGGTRQLFSRPLLAGALSLILIVAIVVAWRGYGERIDDGSAVAESCLEGEGVVPIIADPAIAPALQEMAKAYNALDPIVRDHCVTVEVRPADAQATLEGLTAKTWDAQAYGAYPGAWVPESSVWAAALEVAAPTTLAGRPQSLVSSPVRLAVEPELADAADGRIAWGDLPALTRANSLGAFGHRSWGSIRMAMPTGPQSDATSLAAQAVAAVTADATGPLTAEQASSSEVVTAVTQLMSAPPSAGDGSVDAAVQSISASTDPSTAPIRAVPITEQHLYLLTKDDAEATVAAVAPTGPTPQVDYPVITLAGTQVQAFVADATAEFFTFARKPEQMKLLTQAGFRGTGPLPKNTATVSFDEVTDPLPIPEPAASVEIDKTLRSES